MTTRRIGIGGGVFDPIHIGHLFLFNECADRLDLEKILLIPTYIAVHKPSERMSEYDCRREMVKLVCERNDRFELCEIEKKAGGLSYTIETIRALKKVKPDAEFYFIVGLDNLEKMEDWYHPDEILSEATVVVGSRPVESISSNPKYADRIKYLDIPKLEISSTDIRARVKAGRSIKYLVPPDVERYIIEKKLYTK